MFSICSLQREQGAGLQVLSKQRALEHLRARIETIEKRPPLADAARTLAPGLAGFALPSGMLHEVFVDGPRESGAGLGFSLGAARTMLSPERPVLLYLQLGNETQETGFPYGPGLLSFGIDPKAVVVIRAHTIVELLWAAEEALACIGVAAVIADVATDPKALDFTASRRLGMRATQSRTTFFLLRYGLGRTASAARMRWHLTPALSGEVRFDPREPGESRWRLTLEKGLWHGKPNGEWLLSWTKNGFELVDPRAGDRAAADRVAAAAPVPGAVPRPLGDRLAQTA
jgi:protein ImuA